MGEIDPNGCERCGIVGCPLPAARAADIAAKAAGGEWKATHTACNEAFAVCFQRTPFAVDWREFAARQRDEQRGKAMEAAARVYAHIDDVPMNEDARMSRAKFDLPVLIRGRAPINDAQKAALVVLRAFGIVKT